MSSQAFNHAFDTSVSLVGVLFMTGSFLANYGRTACDTAPGKGKKTFHARQEWSFLPQNRLRKVAVLLSASLFIAEDAILIKNEPDLLLILNHLIATGSFACAWLLVFWRNRLIVKETLWLSLISLLYCTPPGMVDFSSAFTLLKPSLTVHSAQVLVLDGFVFDCLLRLLASRRSLKLGYESAPSPGELDEKNFPKDDSDSDSDDSDCDSDNGKSTKEEPTQNDAVENDKTWAEYYARFKPLLKCLVPPKDDHWVQMCYLVSLIILFGGRYLNILLPTCGAAITDKVFAGDFPYTDIVSYWAITLAKGSLIRGVIRNVAEADIEILSYRQLILESYGHVMQMDMNYHAGQSTGTTISNMRGSYGLSTLYNELTGILVPSIFDALTAFVVLCTRFNASIALLMGIASCSYVCLRMYTAGLYVASRRKSRKAYQKQSNIMDESIRGWTSIVTFNMFEYWGTRFEKSVDRYLRKSRQYEVLLACIQGGCDILLPTTFMALSALILAEISAGRASPGDYVFFVQYWDRISGPIQNISSFYRYVLDSLTDAEQTCDLLAKQPKVTDKEGALALSAVRGQVQLEGAALSFGKKKALEEVTLSVSPGELIGVVGATGSGKTSLMNLIRRVYDVDCGSVKIDGHDVRDITQSSLRDSICIVPQHPFFFNTTIMKNLRYAQPSATDEEIHEACRAACIHDQIMKFPKGYKSVVGENGIKLSGGEQQRLAIASVLLKKAPIMILDEATSAVDTETERQIQLALKNIHGRQTTFVVAHRLSTITKANQIIVLGEGKILEKGTHKQLRDKGGKYSVLWKAMVECMLDDD